MNTYHLKTCCFPASGIRPGHVPAKPIHSANIVLPAAPEPVAGNNLRRALFAKSRKKSLALGLIGMVFSLSLHAQTPQPGASPATGRVMFADSIKEVRTGAPLITSGASATLARSELTQAEAEAKLEFSVALKMRDFAELQQRIRNGEIVSLDEMAAKYYPAMADYELVVKWLTAQGFAVKPADKYNLSVFASGSVAQIERAFEMKFVRVQFARVESTSALTAPSLPAAVAAPVLGINGLQPHVHPRPHSIIAPRQPQKLINNNPPYTVPELAKAYNAGAGTGDGTGQKIGIVIDTFPASSDLTKFWQDNQVAQSLNNIEEVQVVSGSLPSPSGEETLDVEWSSGMAPGAKVRVYATTDLASVHLDNAYQQIINDLPSQPALHQISLSFGLGETYALKAQMQTDAQYFATMAAAGVTVFVSSGDGGSSPGPAGYGDTTGPVQVESPANDPNVTSVGGISLSLNSATGAVTGESAWIYGGGGISQFFARPAWQTGTGVPSGSFRLVPDVALPADPNTGGFLILNGQLATIGGTSWSAPTWAGICARINQARANAGQPSLGLLGPRIYPLIGTANFRDITTGNNGPKGGYNAGPGYDLCTGVGVPNVAALIQTLTKDHHPVAKDFNGDGYADLVWENTSTGACVIWVMHNGVPASSISLPTVSTQWHIAGAADFLGTGQAGLVWENTTTGERGIWVMHNGVFASYISLPTVSTQWHIAGAADFLGTGQAGLVWENTTTGARGIWVMHNGVFASYISLPTVSTQWHILDH